MIASFTIPGPPKGKGRHRTRIVKTKSGKQFTTNYTPEETARYENMVVMFFKQQCPGIWLDGPLKVTIKSYFTIPKSWSKKKRAAAVWCMTKPDKDNIEKIICDSLNKIAYDDDSQMCLDGGSCKRYGDEYRVDVEIEELEPSN